MNRNMSEITCISINEGSSVSVIDLLYPFITAKGYIVITLNVENFIHPFKGSNYLRDELIWCTTQTHSHW
jgi:hypothetical protein